MMIPRISFPRVPGGRKIAAQLVLVVVAAYERFQGAQRDEKLRPKLIDVL